MAKGRKTGGRKRESDWEKFSRSVSPFPELNGCYEWKGSIHPYKGYGRMMIWNSERSRKETVPAHRMAWKLFVGEIPAGNHVLHTCDNPRCVFVDHLFLGGDLENQRDRIEKERLKRNEKLRRNDVIAIRQTYAKGEVSQTALAKSYGIAPCTVSNIVTGRRHKQWLGLV